MQIVTLHIEGTRYTACLARLLLFLLACLSLLQSGCVRRRLMIRSQPSGALVYVDNQQVGTTPCAVDFTYYGTREIRLVKSGYETLTVDQPIPTPWYEMTPLDFISENLVPYKIRDNRTVSFNLSPALIVPSQELLNRAESLRQETMRGAVMPAGSFAPLGTPQPVPGEVTSAPSVGQVTNSPQTGGPDLSGTEGSLPSGTQTFGAPVSSISPEPLLSPPTSGLSFGEGNRSPSSPSLAWPPTTGRSQ